MNQLLAIIATISLVLTSPAEAKSSCTTIDVKGQGEDIILIHGFLSRSDVWEQTAKTLSKTHTVHLVQIAGQGGAEPCSHNGNILAKVKDELNQYTSAMPEKSVTLMGHSMGAFMSYWLAMDNPKIKAVIGVDGLPFIGPVFTRSADTQVSDLAPQRQFIKQMYTMATPDKMADMARQGVVIQATDAADQNRIIASAKVSDAKTSAAIMDTLLGTDLRSQMNKVNVPLLLIAGFGGFNQAIHIDAATTLYKQQLELAPQAKLSVNKKARHFIMWDDFDGFINTVTAFLKETDNAG